MTRPLRTYNKRAQRRERDSKYSGLIEWAYASHMLLASGDADWPGAGLAGRRFSAVWIDEPMTEDEFRREYETHWPRDDMVDALLYVLDTSPPLAYKPVSVIGVDYAIGPDFSADWTPPRRKPK